MVAFIDVEHALDPGYARACGVNVDELLVSQPDTGEQALEITETLIRSGGIDCVVVDSVAALVPRAEIEGEMGDSFVGIQARLMSQALRKLTGAVSRSNTALVFTNQLREKIGVMFGNPETTPGGRALKFYASVRLDIRRIETIKTGTESVGNRVPGQGRQEQGRAAVPGRRVRHHVRRGHLQGGRPARRRRRDGRRHQDRRLVHLRRDPPRPGSRGVQGVPQGEPADRRTRSTGGSGPRSTRSRSRSRASKRPRPDRIDPASMSETAGGGRRASYAERRERRAAVEDPTVVLEAAARFLEARSRSVAEVRRRLTGAGYRSDLVDGAVERLVDLGMLDDEAFARAWIESRDRARPRGERAIRQELALKGIDRSTVDLVLNERRDAMAGLPADEGRPYSADEAAAKRLLARNARSLARVADPRQRRQRAYALLARNGFDPEICRIMAAAVDGDPVDEGDDD